MGFVILFTYENIQQNQMNFISRLFGRGTDDKQKAIGMEDYMALVRVYFQATLASRLGITNLAMLPDLRTFKSTLHVPTVYCILRMAS